MVGHIICIHKHFTNVCGDATVDVSTVQHCFKDCSEAAEGQSSLANAECWGCPPTAVTPNNIHELKTSSVVAAGKGSVLAIIKHLGY